MNRSTLIIDDSDALGYGFKAIQAVLTLFFWCAWIYLALPLASPVASLIGFDVMFHGQMDLGMFVGILVTISLLLGHVFISVAMWRYYNLRQYRGSQRQEKERAVSFILKDELAGHFDVNILDLDVWQKSRKLNIKLTDTGSIQYVQMPGLT